MVKRLGQPSSRRVALAETASQVMDTLEHSLEAPLDDAAGDYLRIPLDEMRPDPNNPRWGSRGGLTFDELTNPDQVQDPRKKADIEDIIGLAASMRPPVGQRKPIEVWKNGSWYEIVDGERRYWALRLNGATLADVKLLPEHPRRVRLVQYVTNFQHKQLALTAQLDNLHQIIQEAESTGEPVTSAADLTKLIGFSRAMGFKWWGVLFGPDDVRDAIRNGAVTSLNDAYAIAGVEDASKRAEMIRDPAQRISEAPVASKRAAANSPPQRGRRQKFVYFGKTENTAVVRFLIEKLDPDGDYSRINWEQPKAAANAWKRLLSRLEKEVTQGAKNGR